MLPGHVGQGWQLRVPLLWTLSSRAQVPAPGLYTTVAGQSPQIRGSPLGRWLLNTHSCVLTRSCPTLCDSMDSSLPGSSVHDIFQARILE